MKKLKGGDRCKTKKIMKMILISFIIIFLVIGVMSSYMLTEEFIEYKENENITEELIQETISINEETKEIESIDWNYLKSVNSDIIAWLEIEGTNINYPILKDNDSLYYMNHTFDKKYNKHGAIFTIETYPFTKEETTIYGHNMKNGSMFSNLGKYLNKDFFNSHLKLKIYTPEDTYEGSIFSAYTIAIEKESENIKDLDFNEKIDYYKSASKFKVETKSDIINIVKLSTCSYINANTTPTNQRYYIIASIEKID